MLTADLVRAFVRKGELSVRSLKGPRRERTLAIAEAYIGVFSDAEGVSRDELDDELNAVEISSQDHRIALGLRKLLMDRCDFSSAADGDPVQLRKQLFEEAAIMRRQADLDRDTFRDAVLTRVADATGLTRETIEEQLYADLRSEQKLVAYGGTTAERLV